VGDPTVVSEREQEVLAAVADHLTNAEIGQRLHISVRTVESHVSSLLRKLGVADRRELARYGRHVVAEPADGDAGPAIGALRGGPAALTSFVGRSADLEAVAEALANARLVNLVGPGGVGKTRLAVEAGARAAARFPDGAWFVDLVPVRSGGVATAVAAAMGLVDRSNQSLEDVIEGAVRGGRALLLVDNCEHVLEEAAVLLERLLLACPGLRVVATSRELLGVTGERVVPVAPLADADAVTLFVDRAASLDPTFSGDDLDSVAEVCARLDGIPLAIELASARCAVLGLDGVRAGLTDRLRLLAVRRPEDRHRSLRNVLDWSYELLDATERTVLRRLAVFAGDVTAADAATVVADPEASAEATPGAGAGPETIDEAGIDVDAAIDGIAQLTAKSLLVRHSTGGTSVYRLLETVHEYVLERLEESGEADAVRRRHLAWALEAVTTTEAGLVAGEDWRPRFDAIADDARVALTWAAPLPEAAPEAHALAVSYAHLAYARRFLAEAQARYEQAADLAADDRTAAADLRQAAAVGYARMRGDLGYRAYLQAAERAAGVDPGAAARSLADAAALAWRCPAEFPVVPDQDEVTSLLSRAEALDPGDDPTVSAHIAVARAWLSTRQPLAPELATAQAAVDAARAVGDLPLLSAALDAETAALWDLGRTTDAYHLADRRLALLDQMERHEPRAGGEVIDILHMAADTALAAGRFSEALDVAIRMRKEEVGDTAPHATNREAVIALTFLGRFTEAVAEADAMRRDWERAGRPTAGWMTPAAASAGLAHALLGDRRSADEWAAVTRHVAGSGFLHSAKRAIMAFAEARAALHEGRLDDAVAAADWKGRPPKTYTAYIVALAAELAVVTGAPDAADRVAAARDLVDDNPWALACLLRAQARLHDDAETMRAALDAFDEVDARYEWAVTALLVGGPVADEGRATLARLGVSTPG
jgi:predicted ATPase/DNA-binding CsgD family transcriptional regulator